MIMEDNDTGKFFQTPPDVCKYMVSLMPWYTSGALEPTAGSGNIVRALKERFEGISVTAPDDIFPFLKSNTEWFDCVIMNPPFSSRYAYNVPDDIKNCGMKIGYYILSECMKRSDHVIALVPWYIVTNSDKRLKYMMDYGLVSVTALPRSVFPNSRVQTVILELERGFLGHTVFKRYNGKTGYAQADDAGM